MKQMLEGQPVTEKTRLHLDRCLTCRACETACPSGVHYARLADIGRNMLEKQVARGTVEGVKRYLLRRVIPDAGVFGSLFRLGQYVKPVLPASIRDALPATPPVATSSRPQPLVRHARKMLVLEGCVQPALAPNINAATARVLDRLGISLVRAAGAGCCGAVSYHLNAQQEGLEYMRRNIDAWWPWLDDSHDGGVEAIVITASGCGVTVREYGELLKHDPVYAAKAARISGLARDISEVIETAADQLASLVPPSAHPDHTQNMPAIAFHSPCTLQHGMRIRNVVEKILVMTGCKLTFVPDSHLCCGSAGTYSILQPELSGQLRKNKVIALESGKPACIVTANIGCLTHLQGGTLLPVRHWIELVDDVLSCV